MGGWPGGRPGMVHSWPALPARPAAPQRGMLWHAVRRPVSSLITTTSIAFRGSAVSKNICTRERAPPHSHSAAGPGHHRDSQAPPGPGRRSFPLLILTRTRALGGRMEVSALSLPSASPAAHALLVCGPDWNRQPCGAHTECRQHTSPQHTGRNLDVVGAGHSPPVPLQALPLGCGSRARARIHAPFSSPPAPDTSGRHWSSALLDQPPFHRHSDITLFKTLPWTGSGHPGL